jgi:hypothetical protein
MLPVHVELIRACVERFMSTRPYVRVHCKKVEIDNKTIVMDTIRETEETKALTPTCSNVSMYYSKAANTSTWTKVTLLE